MNLHLQGMWVAFTIAAILTASFVVKLSSALERRDAAMAEMRERTARTERLASVTMLAAGAAHELERSIRALPTAQAQLRIEDAIHRSRARSRSCWWSARPAWS
jgi:two-component system sensor histidine kinase RegB